MKISKLYTYPIKSLREVPLTEAAVTGTGFKYDRRFILLKVNRDEDGTETLKSMQVPHYPEMSRFLTDIVFPTEQDQDSGRIIVTYQPPGFENNHPSVKKLEVPLQPDVSGLKELNVDLHSSPTKAYDMGSGYNDWFSECFGYRVVLAYLGPHSRKVLGSFAPGKSSAHREMSTPLISTRSSLGILALLTLLLNVVEMPETRGDLVSLMTPGVVATIGAVLLSFLLVRILSSSGTGGKRKEEVITFADTAPYLLASQTSIDNISARLAGDLEMDVTKFRPNIVISGAKTAFEEDFWAELTVGEGTARLLLTANCVRCQSVNVDYATGKMGEGEMGTVLKKLMKDRRVDKGAKYSPVFGRYTFLDPRSEDVVIRVGDDVEVLRTMEERTVFDWPGVAN